jgi:uracil-DNA glycosylase family 4
LTLKRVDPFGPSDAEIAFVGQSPGGDEALSGRPFTGPSGRVLRGWMRDAGIDDSACYYTNVVLDFHTDEPNYKPTEPEIREARLRLAGELGALPNLRAIVLVGNVAAKIAFDGDMLGGISRTQGREATFAIDDWRLHGADVSGTPNMPTYTPREIPCVASYHPAYYLRAKDIRKRHQIAADIQICLARARHGLGRVVVLPDAVWCSPQPFGKSARVLGYDCETSGTPETLARMGKNVRVDPRACTLICVGLSDGRIARRFDLASDDEPVAYNMPFDAVASGVWDANWHDPKMLAHLLGEEVTEMKGLAMRWLGKPMLGFRSALPDGDPGTWPEDDWQRFIGYCVQDAQTHLEILNEGTRRASTRIRWLYDNIERPMLRIAARWTMRGVFTLDRNAASEFIEKYSASLSETRIDLQNALGVENLNSPIQLQKALGLKSSAEKELVKYRDRREIAALIEYKKRLKDLNTYVVPWYEWPFERIGTYWRPTGSPARPSSATLNLQNIPAAMKPLLGVKPGRKLLSADFGQAEVRVAAHISGDPRLRELCESSDMHAVTGEMVGGVGDRRYWKVCLFGGVLYGGDEYSVSTQAAKYGLAATPELLRTLRSMISRLSQQFPVYFDYCRRIKRLLATGAPIPGLFGREFHIPTDGDRPHRERVAVNLPTQAGAVDILKLAVLALERAGFETVHQIHDDVLVEVDARDDTPLNANGTNDLRESIRSVMTSCAKLSVPLVVDIKEWASH